MFDGFGVGDFDGYALGLSVGDDVANMREVGHEQVLFQNSGHDSVVMVMEATASQRVLMTADDHPDFGVFDSTEIADGVVEV